MGLAVVGLALLGICGLYYLYYDPLDVSYAPNIILGFSFGASTIALFAKAGGGIYTKTADIGESLADMYEAKGDRKAMLEHLQLALEACEATGDTRKTKALRRRMTRAQKPS